MSKVKQLTPEQITPQKKKRDEWIDIALHRDNFDREEVEAGVKWLYYISNLKEPEVVLVDGPKDFAKKFKASVRASVRDSVRASVRDSVWASVWDSVWDSVRASVWDSVWASVRDSVRASVWDSVWASVWDSVSWISLCGDAEFGAWYEYWKEAGIIVPQEKADKYVGYLRSGAFYVFFFEKITYVMRRPIVVLQDEQKRLHSTTGPALAFKDGTEIYKLRGVTFEKDWWQKIVNDEFTPEEVFAIDNLEHRRIAYEFMDKTKMKSLKDYKVLDEQVDEKGNPMKVISFTVKGVDEPLKYYNCFCPSTKREYFIGTDCDTCVKAKTKSFGLEDVEFIDEW